MPVAPDHALAYAEHVLRTLTKFKAAADAADTQDNALEWRRKIGNAVQYQQELVTCLKEHGFGLAATTATPDLIITCPHCSAQSAVRS